MEQENIILECPSCGAQFSVRAEALGPRGRQVRCSKCKYQWHAVADPWAIPEPEEDFARDFEIAEQTEVAVTEEIDWQTEPIEDYSAATPESESFEQPDSAPVRTDEAEDERDPFGILANAFADRPGTSNDESESDATIRRASADMFGGPVEPETTYEPATADTFPPRASDTGADDERPRELPEPAEAEAVETTETVPIETVPIETETAEAEREPAPAPEPEVEAEPRPARRRSTTGRALAASFLALCFVLAALTVAALFMQSQIVAWLPAASRIYALVGLQPETLGRGLQILEPTPLKRVDRDDEVLVIAGEIRNTIDRAIAVPLMRASLLDQEGRELRIWTFEADRTEIEPGQTASYKTEFRNPPAEAAKLDITFARPGDVEVANKPAPEPQGGETQP